MIFSLNNIKYFCAVKALQKLNPYLLKHKKLLLLGTLYIFLSNLLAIYGFEYIRKALNELAKAKQSKNLLNDLLIYSSIYIVLNIVAGIFKYYQRQTIIVASRQIEFDLRKNIYKHYQKLNYSFYKQNKIGDLMNRISEDVSNVRMYLGPGIMYFINLVFMLGIVLIQMLWLDAELTFYSLAPLPILSVLIYLVSDKINQKSKLAQKSQSDLSSFVQDSFSGIRVIKSYNKENYISEMYQNQAKVYKRNTLSLVNTEAYFFSLMILFIGVSNLSIILVGGKKYFQGEIDVGTLGIFFLYINMLIWPFTSLGWITSLLQRAEASMARINEFTDTKPENLQTEFAEIDIKGKIEFKNVTYTYPNTGIIALQNVNFIIEKGESLAIMGNTGSGKSTIALLISGFIKADSGMILIDDIPIQQLNLQSLRNAIGFISQEAFLFSDTIYNNIVFGLDEHSLQKVENIAKTAEIHQNIQGFSDNYNTQVGERGVMLSGGQKQRLSIARALIKKSTLLIFDDSLSALDTETEEAILKNILNEIENKTSIIITHRISGTKNTDKILILEQGKVIEFGWKDELLSQNSQYKSLYDKQLSE